MSEVSPVATGSEDLRLQFMKLLVAQLRNQNPLEPMDNSEMTSQLAQISSLEQLEAINGNLSGLSGQVSAFESAMALAEGRYATSLIGRTITFTTPDGGVAGGCVDGVERVDGEFVLQVGDEQVTLEAVEAIRE